MNASTETVAMTRAERVALLEREQVETYCVNPARETVLRLRKEVLSKAQITDARSILNDAIDQPLSIDANRAADVLTDLMAALAGGAR
ncbi:MAG TPA: hypothetical protein VGD78_07135 [Chthoniobacterales bacterium]